MATSSPAIDRVSDGISQGRDSGSSGDLGECRQGRVRVSHSDCPARVCVKHGWIERTGERIVCVPNRLIVEVVGSDDPPVDAIVQ